MDSGPTVTFDVCEIGITLALLVVTNTVPLPHSPVDPCSGSKSTIMCTDNAFFFRGYSSQASCMHYSDLCLPFSKPS